MYHIPHPAARRDVVKNLKQAQALVENAVKFLQYAKATAPEEVYLGYDVDDRLYQCRRLASDIGEHAERALIEHEEEEA
jgi:hypothetical protein